LLTLAQKPNVLLLDEPTNDLDLDTLRALEDFLDDWPGALIVVSHDRAFLERTVTDVLVLDGDGRAERRPGGYAAWDEARRRRTSSRSRVAPSVAPATAAPALAPVEAERAATAPSAQARAPKAKPASGRSHATLRTLLKEAEREMARLEKARQRLEGEVTAAAETGDHAALARLGAALTAAQDDLAGAEERWLAVSEELEAR
ncbi:MAG: ABC transporter ATP-binding protein, partial [Acidimicrobiales bacterium]